MTSMYCERLLHNGSSLVTVTVNSFCPLISLSPICAVNLTNFSFSLLSFSWWISDFMTLFPYFVLSTTACTNLNLFRRAFYYLKNDPDIFCTTRRQCILWMPHWDQLPLPWLLTLIRSNEQREFCWTQCWNTAQMTNTVSSLLLFLKFHQHLQPHK